MTNPLLSKWATPFQLPPFDVITDDNFAPAVDAALAQARENITEIAENPVALEYGAFSSVQTDAGREMRFVRNPLAARNFNETPAPALGQHTAEILTEIGLDT